MHSDEYQNTVYQNFVAIVVDDNGDYMTSRSLKSRCIIIVVVVVVVVLNMLYSDILMKNTAVALGSVTSASFQLIDN